MKLWQQQSLQLQLSFRLMHRKKTIVKYAKIKIKIAKYIHSGKDNTQLKHSNSTKSIIDKNFKTTTRFYFINKLIANTQHCQHPLWRRIDVDPATACGILFINIYVVVVAFIVVNFCFRAIRCFFFLFILLQWNPDWHFVKI